MKILIQARKCGYDVLYPKPTPTEFFQFACDIQQIDPQNDARYYGKSVYSIAFTNGGCIFTQFIIGYDVQRGYLGNVGISVFIPNTQKLSGADVKTLLDELVNTYCKNYCPDFHIDSKKQEDWLLFTSLANSYDAKLRDVSGDNVENMLSGTKDPAFIYYKSDSELQAYFDKPFQQEEYNDYKQILFIDNKFRDNSVNPLNVLRNSGVELKDIDLKNEYYYLNNYNSGKGVTIFVLGKDGSWESRSDEKNNNYIRTKSTIKIEYSKDDRYYETIKEEGTLFDTNIQKYLEIVENCIKIKYEAFNPIEKSKTIPIKVKDGESNQINGAEIIYEKECQPQQVTRDYSITFYGEEIGKRCIVFAKKGENFHSNQYDFIPAQQNERIDLVLEEHRKISFHIVDSDDKPVFDYNIQMKDKRGKIISRSKDFVFVGEDIDKSFRITILRNKHKSETFIYCPAKHSATLKLENKGNNRNKKRIKKLIWIFGSAAIFIITTILIIIFFKTDNTDEKAKEQTSTIPTSKH